MGIRHSGAWKDPFYDLRHQGAWKGVQELSVREGGVWKPYWVASPDFVFTEMNQPTNFEDSSGANNGSYFSFVTSPRVYGDRSFRLDAPSTTSSRTLTWEDSPVYTDQQALALVRYNATAVSASRPGGISLRANINNSEGYHIGIEDGSRIRIREVQSGGASSILGTWNGFDPLANTWFWFRAMAIGNQIMIRAWQYGNLEPGNWPLTVTGNDFSAGQLAVFTNSADSGRVFWDYLAFTDNTDLLIPIP